MDIDLLNRDQKVEFVERVHELAQLAEEWARSTTPLTDVELDRFQLLCNEFGVSESSLIARFQRKAREEAIDRTFSQPRVPAPEYFAKLPQRKPQPVPGPKTAHERWLEEQAGRDQAYSDADRPVVVTAEDLRKSVPVSEGEKFDNENHIDPEGDMLVEPVRKPGKPKPQRARVVGAVPNDPHGKIKLAPPELPVEQTTSIEAVIDDKKEA